MAVTMNIAVTRALDGDVDVSSSLGAREALRRLIEHLEAGLNGSKTIDSFAVRDTAVQGTATITLTNFAAGTVLLINGVPFTSIGSGTAVVANNEFLISGTDTADATALAAAINNSTTTGIAGVVTATSAAAVVTVTAANGGLGNNAVTIENLGVVATGTITCSSVDNNDTVTINGVVLTAKTTVTDATIQWDTDGTDTVVAAALAALINSTATDALITKHVRALSRAGVVHLFAKYGGTAGNAITLASSDGTDLAVSAARLAGGTVTQFEGVQASGTITMASAANAETVTINGVVLTAHTNTDAADQFAIDGDDTTDAAKLVRAINNSTSAGLAEVIATSSAAVVTVKARRGGHQGNAITLESSNGTTMAVSGARLTLGAVPTVAVIAGGTATTYGGGARLTGGTNETAISYTI